LDVGCYSPVRGNCSTQNSKAEGTTDNVAVKDAAAVPAEAAGKPIKLTKQQFLDQIMDYEKNKEWIYKGELPGLIDFYADWCRPCRMTAPIMEELAAEYAGRVTIYKIDIQAEQELAAIFGVQSIPTFLFMPKQGQPVMSSGIAQTPEETKDMFKQQIEQVLLGAPGTAR